MAATDAVRQKRKKEDFLYLKFPIIKMEKTLTKSRKIHILIEEYEDKSCDRKSRRQSGFSEKGCRWL